MVASRVNVVVQGIDKVTEVVKASMANIRQLAPGFRNLGAGIGDQLGAGSKGVLGDVVLGSLGAGAIMSSVSSVFGAIQSGIQASRQSLTDAANTETQWIARASDVASNIGVSLGEARKSWEAIQLGIATKAAVLPGETRDYNQVADGISTPLAKLYQGNMTGFSSALTDLTTRVGVLSVVNKADAGMSGAAIGRAISGDSGLGELFTIDIFQKSSKLTDGIRESLKDMGKSTDDWKKLTSEQRLAILTNALKSATPDSLIKAYEGTTESILQGWKTKLFDPLVGLFGFLRRLPDGRNALDAFAGLLTQVDGLMSTIAKASGLSFDPMVALVQGFDFLASLANKGAQLVAGLRKGPDLAEYLGQLTANLSLWLADGARGLSGYLMNLDTSEVAANISHWLSELIGGLTGVAASVDWGGIGFLVGQVLGAGVAILGQVLINPELWTSAIVALVSGVTNGLSLLGGLVLGTFGQLGLGLVQLGNSALGGLVPVRAEWDRALSAAKSLVSDIWLGIQQTWNDLKSLLDQAKQAISGWASQVGGALNFVANPVQGIAQAAEGSKPLEVLKGAGDFVSSVFAPKVNVTGSPVSSPQDLADQVLDKLGSLYNQAQNAVMN